MNEYKTFYGAFKTPITSLRDARQRLTNTIAEADKLVAEVNASRQFKTANSLRKAPWLEALERKNEMARGLAQAIENTRGHPHLAKHLDLGWEHELQIARDAEAYSFSGQALEAIKLASKSLPNDVTLEGENIPGDGQGFWWFDPPLPVQTSNTNEFVHAMLFGMHVTVSKEEEARVMRIDNEFSELEGPLNAWMDFSTWTLNEKGTMVPSTTWSWKIGTPIEELIYNVGLSYDKSYGPGGKLEKSQSVTYGKEGTTNAIRQLSQFFLASCVWIKQDIIEAAPQHVERHLAKRLQREIKSAKRATVKVIALRRKHIQHTADDDMKPTDGESKPREWTCQWVVSGHWRNQPFGPERSAHKLIYINPFVKGPDDKPLKPVQKKVYAVMR